MLSKKDLELIEIEKDEEEQIEYRVRIIKHCFLFLQKSAYMTCIKPSEVKKEVFTELQTALWHYVYGEIADRLDDIAYKLQLMSIESSQLKTIDAIYKDIQMLRLKCRNVQP